MESDEGSLKLNELTDLVTKLSERIGVLEDDLRKTKKTYSSAFTKLILRVKKLEARVKIGKARRRAKVVLSDEDVEDDYSKQGRKLTDAEVQEKASTETEPFIQEVTSTEVIQDQGSSEKGSVEVSTAGATKDTASEVPVRSAEASTNDNGEFQITATIDGHSMSITEATLRRHLKLDDQDGVISIPNSEIFKQLALMRYHTNSDNQKKTACEQFNSNIATDVISEHHFSTPHESPLQVVHSHGSDEGSLKLNELTNLVTKLSERIRVLEDDLRKTKKTYSSAFTKLILRVKKLEARGKKLTDAEVQEKASTETKPFIQEVTPTEVIQDQGSSEKGRVEVCTAGEPKGTTSEVPMVSTVEENISTAGRTVTYTRRSEEKRTRKDKGKAIMIESEPKKKSKKEIEQERLSFAEAIRLEEQMNEEQRAQIARDEEIARQ
ncbi:hypothetical protein Tco_1491470 [Tanacetum coccineum]